MASAPQIGMDKAELKKLLVRSKKEPVNCAVGIGKEQQAMILLHKIKQPRALLQELEKEAGGGLKNPCFGSAFVDIDEDPKLVFLTVNKAGGGIARKLKKSLKGTGFTKVVIKLEDGTIVDSAEEEDEEEEGQASAPAPVQSAAPVEPQAPAEEPVDFAALRHMLAGMIPKIPSAAGTDAGRLDTLKKLAGAAAAALKTEDGPAAIAAVTELDAAISGASQGASAQPDGGAAKPGDGASGAAVRVAKGLLLWNGTRSHVQQEIKKLQSAILDKASDEPDFDDIQANIGVIDTILDRLDNRLSQKLEALRGESDPEAKLALSEEAKAIVMEYQTFIAEDELVNAIDDNGIEPVVIKPRLAVALDAMLKVI